MNYASYQPGTFTIDVSNFTVGEQLFEPADMPAFLHEYCHYIQDISMISAIFGFSLWMRDLVDLTRIFSDGEGKTIMLPLGKNEQGQPINQYRKFYSLFCGSPDHVFDLDYATIRYHHVEPEDKTIPLGNGELLIRLNRIIMDGRPEPLEFRLIALQEIHACYAQQLAEQHYLKKHPGIEFNVPSAGLAAYPYHFGDHLFEVFDVTLPLEVKFVLVGLCLDTIQAPSVFLIVLEQIRGKAFGTEDESVNQLIAEVEIARQKCSYGNDEALAQILPDLEDWSKDTRRPDFAAALEWYITMIKMAFDFKETIPAGFNLYFCQGIGALAQLYTTYPSPAFLKDGALDGNQSANGDTGQDMIYLLNHTAASTFWILRKLYDFLCSSDIDTLMNHSKCPLYERCVVRPTLGEDYTCANSPWEIVKGKKQVPCIYGRAAVSMGLWQNSIDFNFE